MTEIDLEYIGPMLVMLCLDGLLLICIARNTEGEVRGDKR